MDLPMDLTCPSCKSHISVKKGKMDNILSTTLVPDVMTQKTLYGSVLEPQALFSFCQNEIISKIMFL